MTLAEERRLVFIKERENRLAGNLNGLPLFYTFPKLATIIPTIPEGYPILVTANSGIGKTQSWIGIFIYTVYKLKKEHPEVNLKIKLVIALLEDTRDILIDRLYSMLLFEVFGIVVPFDELHSWKQRIMSEDTLAKLEVVQREVDFILEDCEILDSVYNPTGIYKWARAISNKYGKHKAKEMQFSDENGNTTMQSVYSHYEAEDPTQQVIMIVDNLNNLASELRDGRSLSERETINLWTRQYTRLQITKHWKWTVINIIQQASDSEKQQFSLMGKTIVEKIKPSLDGLGNSKECQRDHFMVLGLFAPDRYGINSYEGYNIGIMGDHFRSLIVLKSNISVTNVEIPLLFNGACYSFKELPRSNEINPLTFYTQFQ